MHATWGKTDFLVRLATCNNADCYRYYEYEYIPFYSFCFVANQVFWMNYLQLHPNLFRSQFFGRSSEKGSVQVIETSEFIGEGCWCHRMTCSMWWAENFIRNIHYQCLIRRCPDYESNLVIKVKAHQVSWIRHWSPDEIPIELHATDDPIQISSIGLVAVMTRCTGLKHLNIANCGSVSLLIYLNFWHTKMPNWTTLLTPEIPNSFDQHKRPRRVILTPW